MRTCRSGSMPLLQLRTDRDDRFGIAQRSLLKPMKQFDEPLRRREAEVHNLLRQARMHVVDEREPKNRLEEPAPEYGFLVRVDECVPVSHQQSNGPHHHKDVQKSFE